ncbi:hypothetical protein Emag_006188 [Eimeria magna]
MASGLELAAFCAAESASLPLLPPRKDEARTQCAQIVGGRRHDGRLPEEALEAPLHIQTLSLGSASGSAFLSVGNTKVYCAIFGPRSVGRSDLQDRGYIKVDYRGSPFFSKNANDGAESNERNAMLLHQALDSVVHLDKYPKSILDVCVLVLEDDGGALASALTCAGLALADAGVECYDILTGASAYAFTYQDESGGSRQVVCLDLDSALHLLRIAPALEDVRSSAPLREQTNFLRGPLIAGPSGEQLFSLCEAACAEIGREVRRCLQHSFGVKEQRTIQDISFKRPGPEAPPSDLQ